MQTQRGEPFSPSLFAAREEGGVWQGPRFYGGFIFVHAVIPDFIAVCTTKQGFIVRVNAMGITADNCNIVIGTPGKVFVCYPMGWINAVLNCWKSSAVRWAGKRCRILILAILIGFITCFPKLLLRIKNPCHPAGVFCVK